MKQLNEDDLYRYSAPLTAPCGVNIYVWRDRQHPQQDQLKDHINECEQCKDIIKNKYDHIPEYLRGYVENFLFKK